MSAAWRLTITTLNRWVLKIRSAAGDAVLRAQAFGRIQLAIGRDLCEGQGRLEMHLYQSRSTRLAPQYGLPTDRQAGLQSGASFSAQGDKM